VPTRNRARLVGATINAILGQTFRDLEVIIVDDCSRDDTENVIRGYTDERIRYFKHDSGRLVAVNRNYAMSQATGDYLAFCDDDDIWLPDKLDKELREFARDPRLGLVCANAIIFNEKGDVRPFHRAGLTDRDFTLRALLLDNKIISSSVMVRKSVIDDIGMMDTSPALVTGQDYELWLRIARKYPVKYLDIPLIRYRVHTGNITPRGGDAVARRRAIYRRLWAKRLIARPLYWRLIVRVAFYDFLWRTRTMMLASRIKRLFS
jgi:glycosyltransferase involved in cell wall biosynthesis